MPFPQTAHGGSSSPRRRHVLAALALVVALLGGLALGSAAQAAPTVSTVSGSGLSNLILYYSKNAPASYNNQYVGIKVVNDATARTSLWVKITDVAGGNVTLATGETGERNVGAVAANATKTVYFLFKANAKTTTDTTFNIRLYEGAPTAGGTSISTTAAAFTVVDESQNASANKVTGGYVSPAAPTLGSQFQVVLTGLTGTMSNAADSTAVFTPAFAQGWDPRAFELTKVDLQFDFNGAGNTNFTDQLYFPTANNGTTTGQLNNSGGAYTATYTFRAVNKTAASVKPTPVGHIKSGGIWKYTNASSLSSIAPIEPVTNSFIITAEAAPTQSKDGYITYILTLANTSTKTLSVDLLKDVLPSGAVYQAGTTKYNGVAAADPNNSSGTLTWSGPFTVAGGARATLAYRVKATATATATDYSNSATGLVGSTVIDTTLDTSDTAPAIATATVDTDFAGDVTAPTITLSAVDGTSAALANAGSTSSTAATMTFASNESPTTFTCSIDGAAPSSCASPKAYTALAAGSHTFWVYGKDAAGNIGSAGLTWTIVNTSKPEVASFQPTVTATQTSPITYSLQFTKDVAPGSLATSDLSAVTTGSPGTWSVASVIGSGSSYLVSLSSLSPGTTGTVAVKIAANGVTDAANNSLTGPTADQTSGAVSLTNTMDVAITGAAPAAGATSNSSTATFSFGAPAGSYAPDQYMCKGPDDAAFAECVSPVTYAGVTAGSKTFSVYGNAINPDTGAVSSTTSTRTSTWTVDLTAPVATLTTPAAAALLTDSTPALSGACTSGDGNVSIPIYAGAAASGTPVQTATAPCSSSAWSVDAATLADGQYTAQATQADTAGNTSTSAARTFTIDATRPSVAVTGTTASTTTGSAAFTVAFSESVTGFAAGDLVIGGTSTSPTWGVSSITGSGATYTVNLSTTGTPAGGTVTLVVNANAVSDVAGNTGPASSSTVASIDVVLAGDLTDGAVQANNGSPWGRARSVAVAKTSFTQVGGGTPSNKLYRFMAPWSGGACGTFDGGTEISLGTTTDDTTALGDACFRYDLVGTNNSATKTATAQSNTVRVDLTDPTLGSLAIAGGDGQLTNGAAPTIAKGSKSDAASGLDGSAETLTRASTTYSANACGSFAAYDPATEDSIGLGATADSGLASGCYRYTHRVGDNAGNTTTSQSTVKVDVDAPVSGTMSVNSGNAWTRSQNPLLGGTAFADPNSGIPAGGATLAREKATLTGATCGNWSADQASVNDTGGAENDTLTQACYRYTRAATDRAGNAAQATATVKIDHTDPSGGSVSAAGGAEWTRATQPGLSGADYTDANSGISSTSLTRARATLTGSACGTFGVETPVTIAGGADTDSLAQDCYRYTRSGIDNVGNAASSATTLKIDQTDPTGGAVTANGGTGTWTNVAKPGLTRTTPADANSGIDNAATTFTRGFAAFNGSGTCSGVTYGGATAVTIDGNGRDADAGTLGEGCYRYRSSVADAVGNGTTHDATVFIDRTDPIGGSVTTAGGSAWTNAPQPALAGAPYVDANSGIASSDLTRAQATLTGSTCGAFGGESNVTVASGADAATLGQDCYRYTRSATDAAGNVASTTTTVKIDRTDPTPGALAIAGGDGQLVNSTSPSIGHGTDSDANSGIDAGGERLTRAAVGFASGACGTFATYDPNAETVVANGATADSGLGTGCYRYTRRVGDNAGNTVTTSATVKVDVTNPVLGNLSIAGGDGLLSNSAAPSIAKGATSDAASGLKASDEKLTRASTTFTGNACGGFAAYDASAEIDVSLGASADSGLASGCYRYTHRVRDNAGNTTTSAGVVKVDVDDPTSGSLTVNGGNAWTRSQTPALAGSPFTDTNSGIATGGATLRREKATLDGAGCDNDWSVDQPAVNDAGGAEHDPLVQACYRYTRAATDRAGNTAQASGTVKIDRTDPTGGAVTANGGTGTWTNVAKPGLTRTTPADANSGIDNAATTFTRGFAAFNGSGTCSGVTYGGATAVTIDGNGRDADAGTLGEGCYRYRSSVADAVGNGTTHDATVFIDRTDPTGGSIATTTTSGSWADTPSPGLSGSAFTDANSGIDGSSAVTRIVRERAGFVAGGNTCSSNWVVDDTAVTISAGRDASTLTEACYRYVREAADNAGNTGATAPALVRLDLTGPEGGALQANGGTDVDSTEGTPTTLDVATFSDALSGLAAGSETLTRRIAPWTGGSGARPGRLAMADEFGDYGSTEPVTLFGNEDPAAVSPGRYLYEHTVTDVAGNVTRRTALIEIRPPASTPADPSPTPTPAPGPVADPAAGPAPAPNLQLTMVAPATQVRPNVPFPARAILRNSGTATAEGVTFSTTAPGDVVVLAADIRAAGHMEAQLAERCGIAGQKTVTCTIPALDARRQQVIDMVMVTPTGGFRVTLNGDAGATNTDSVHASDSVPSDIDVIDGAGAPTPVLAVRAVALRRTVASGSVVPVVVTTSLGGADVDQFVMSVPASRAARLARIPHGTDPLHGLPGALTAPGMVAGATRHTIMRFRVTGRPGNTMRIPVGVATPGGRPRMARTATITIVAPRDVSVTG